MAHILTVANNKGGTGKSTLCVTFAYGMAQQGCKVLLIDLTSQTTSSSLLLETVQDLPPKDTIWGVLQGDTAIADVVYMSDKGVDVIPSHPSMATVLPHLTRGDHLRDPLAPLAAAYDLVVIDSPGDLNQLVANALAPADQVIIPTRLNRVDFQCAEATLSFIRAARPYIGEKSVRVVINMLDDRYRGAWHNSHTGQWYQKAQAIFADILSPITFPDSQDIRTAFDRGMTVLEYRPQSLIAERFRTFLAAEIAIYCSNKNQT
jgi:chromosome partitioning protein